MDHIYPDNSICLATIGELNNFLSRNPTLLQFINKFIDSFLYSLEWFERYKTYPFGEREHGWQGLLDYYKEEWNVDSQEFIELTKIILNNNYRGHLTCVCDSNLKFRNCHGKFIFPIVTDDFYRMKFAMEVNLMLGDKV